MGRPSSPVMLRERARQYSEAQLRTIAAALELFAHHGVGGTSLRMIADALGVTKAAVYHQFNTRDAIVLAVIEVELARLEAALEQTEAAVGSLQARESLLLRVIDAVIERRRAVSTLQNDPVIVRLLGDYEPSRRLWTRLFAVLLGNDRRKKTRVRAAILSAAIGSVGHPFVADLDNATLRAELLEVARRLILPPGK